MKYIYAHKTEDRINCITKMQNESLDRDENLTLYKVSDDFDLTKEFPLDPLPEDPEAPKTVKLEGFLTKTEFLERYSAQYSETRVNAYPSIEDQLDALYWDKVNGTNKWVEAIAEVKAKNPKPSND